MATIKVIFIFIDFWIKFSIGNLLQISLYLGTKVTIKFKTKNE